MIDCASIAAGFFALALAVHFLSALLAYLKHRRGRAPADATCRGAVTIVRPVCGLDHFDELTLRSTFALCYPDLELIFCAARENDRAVALVRALIAEHLDVRANLLVGDERPTANPKLNNIVKGWRAARTEWVILADSNVLMPPDYVEQLMAAFEPDVGLVCSPPLGSWPIGFAAEVECAFLNTYQARWQCAADAIGFGFAQGKSMLWRRDGLNAAGGIEALGLEIAEDAAATKIVRAQGKRVRLVARPFEQPLGVRRARQVWDRQVRWARLRRATFPLYYAPEILTGSFAPMVALAAAAFDADIDVATALAGGVTVWYGAEAALALAAGWHLRWMSPFAWMLRDLMLPALWIEGLCGDAFTWRGNDMTVASSGSAAR